MTTEKKLFITGKLAEPSLRKVLKDVSKQAGFESEIITLPINVVALATLDWIGSHIQLPEGTKEIVIPGLCRGSELALGELLGVSVVRGPKDLRDIGEFYKLGNNQRENYGKHSLEIIAEINHAPDLNYGQILDKADELVGQGADIIDLGCNPGFTWEDLGRTVQGLKRNGIKVSIDTFNKVEVFAGVRAGADLLLSVHDGNIKSLVDLDVEFVVVPQKPGDLVSIQKTVDLLLAKNKQFRIDPILDPMPFGFTESLVRYFEARKLFPEFPMMMGVGNITELMDSDSSGINTLLMGICQECGIQSVLTTSVINWCRTTVRELDIGRRLMQYAFDNKTIPKRLEPKLHLLRDLSLRRYGLHALREIASQIKDRNFRIFAEDSRIYAINNCCFLSSDDPYELFEYLIRYENIDPSHAFYLGYEFCKAQTAIQLGKNYTQDQELDWGFLTIKEMPHRNPGIKNIKKSGFDEN